MALTDSALLLYNSATQLMADVGAMQLYFREQILTKGPITTVEGNTYIVSPDVLPTYSAPVNADMVQVAAALAAVKTDLGL